MAKINYVYFDGKYSLLGLDADIPDWFPEDGVIINGNKYRSLMVHGLKNHIAVEGKGDFLNQNIVFCRRNN